MFLILGTGKKLEGHCIVIVLVMLALPLPVLCGVTFDEVKLL